MEVEDIDLWELDGELYKAWKLMEKHNYGKAENIIAGLWAKVHKFNLAEEPQEDKDKPRLKSTDDSNLVARITRALYLVMNLYPHRCHKLGYWCEFVYPYGWVPQGGCPIHD